MDNNQTQKLNNLDKISNKGDEILTEVYYSLKEKGYNPVNQIVGYILSGDPTFITNHNNARAIISKIERDDLLEILVKSYLSDIIKVS